MQSLDNNGCVTLFGVFEECKDEIDKGLQELPKGVTKSKRINYRTFSKVIRLYLQISFKMLINGTSVPLLNKFGVLDVVKTKCIRYNPSTFSFFKDENGNLVRKKIKLDLRSGYWYFVFWDSPKNLRQYRFTIDRKYKRMYMDMVEQGFEYLDYTLSGYGKNASPDYIHHIK